MSGMLLEIKRIINKTLRYFGIAFVSTKTLEDMLAARNKVMSLRKWENPEIDSRIRIAIQKQILNDETHSQLQQDALAKWLSDFSNDNSKYFVEFGASDGITFSNTFLLEKKHHWQGLLVEPGKNWHTKLKKNRNCIIDTRCVWSKSHESIEFQENRIGELSGVLTNIADYTFFNYRNRRRSYPVTTISLNDLLDQHQSPHQISYLSIDTEGSEYEIIRDFDFYRYRPLYISIEHNYSQFEKRITKLLESYDYIQIFPNISEWDGWFVDGKNKEIKELFSAKV